MRRSCLVAAVVAAILGLPLCQKARALATETLGNEPLSEANYAECKGIMPLVNGKSRVYETWANGNEHLLYKGTTKDLNAALAHFATVEVKNRLIVLRAGPAAGRSFSRKKIPYNWELHIMGGLARGVWPMDPVLTVYIGGEIELEKIEIPRGVTVRDATALDERTPEASTLNRWAPDDGEERKQHAAAQRRVAEFLEARERGAQK